MPPTTVCFVRHGQVHNPQAVVYARLPRFRLSEEGIQQARLAASALQGRFSRVAAIYSSPLLRARHTARLICAAYPGVPFHLSQMLTETHTPFQGVPIQQMEARHWDLYNGIPPGYEQPQDLLKRALRFYQHAVRSYPGQTVVAVSHGDPIAFLILWVKGQAILSQSRHAISDLGFGDTYPAPGSISMLTCPDDSPGEKPVFEYLNPLRLSE